MSVYLSPSVSVGLSVCLLLSLSLQFFQFPISLFPIARYMFPPPPTPLLLFPSLLLRPHQRPTTSSVFRAKSFVISRSVTLDHRDQSSRSFRDIMTLITAELQSIANGFLATCLGTYSGIVESGMTIEANPFHHLWDFRLQRVYVIAGILHIDESVSYIVACILVS